MTTNLLKLICSMGLLSTMLVANAAWTINPVTGKNWRYEISDGNWVIGCDMIDSDGNFTLGDFGQSRNCVVQGSGNLDLSTINTDLDTNEIDYTLTEIAACTFENASVGNLVLPKTIKVINSYAFKKGISGSVTIEEGSELTHINYEAFRDSKIKSINLNVCTKLEVLARNSFYYCTALTTIGTGELPDSLTLMEQAVFFGCSSLSDDIRSNATMQWKDGEQFRETAITSLVVPNLYGSIGARAIGSCPNLTNVVLSQV